jgi:hypothetical protein
MEWYLLYVEPRNISLMKLEAPKRAKAPDLNYANERVNIHSPCNNTGMFKSVQSIKRASVLCNNNHT